MIANGCFSNDRFIGYCHHSDDDDSPVAPLQARSCSYKYHPANDNDTTQQMLSWFMERIMFILEYNNEMN